MEGGQTGGLGVFARGGKLRESSEKVSDELNKELSKNKLKGRKFFFFFLTSEDLFFFLKGRQYQLTEKN